jgi:uncharacterized circularly permuted ATP-grasp superfamily protein
MRELRDKLKAMVETNLADLKNQLEVQISDKGVTFELRDDPRSPMFVRAERNLPISPNACLGPSPMS